MKLSKIFHVISVIAGIGGVLMVPLALFWSSDTIIFGITKGVMLLCAITALLTAIWLQIATIHHMMLEKRGEIV